MLWTPLFFFAYGSFICPELCSLLTSWCLAKLSIVGLSDAQLAQPRAAWRRALLRPLPYIVRTMMYIFGSLFPPSQDSMHLSINRLLGFYSVSTHGIRADVTKAPIVVSNHLSFIDPIVPTRSFSSLNVVDPHGRLPREQFCVEARGSERSLHWYLPQSYAMHSGTTLFYQVI